MARPRHRPRLRIELEPFGLIDPFSLHVVRGASPPADGGVFLRGPKSQLAPLELVGLNVLGAGQALFGLSGRWLSQAGGLTASGLTPGGLGADGLGPGGLVPGGLGAMDGPGTEDGPESLTGEVRLIVRRREARLLGSLLRRHLARLPQPPPWMRQLQQSFAQIDEFLRWELEPPPEGR